MMMMMMMTMTMMVTRTTTMMMMMLMLMMISIITMTMTMMMMMMFARRESPNALGLPTPAKDPDIRRLENQSSRTPAAELLYTKRTSN